MCDGSLKMKGGKSCNECEYSTCRACLNEDDECVYCHSANYKLQHKDLQLEKKRKINWKYIFLMKYQRIFTLIYNILKR